MYSSALDYFNFRVLPLDHELAWAAGAHYNVGRSLEAGGQRPRRSRSTSPADDAGNLVRAAWLRELDGEKSKIADEGEVGGKENWGKEDRREVGLGLVVMSED